MGQNTDRYLVISADGHAGPPAAQYREYVDPQYRDAFDAALPIQIQLTKDAEKRFLIGDINREWRKGHEYELTGAWDTEARIKVIDGDGDSATHTCYLNLVQSKEAGKTLAMGLYRDELKKIDGAWKFTRREVTIDS